MTRHQIFVGVAAAIVVASVGVRSAGQAKPPAPKPVVAAKPTAPRPAAAKPAATKPPTEAAFKAVTTTLFNDTCGTCHNDIELAGGFDIFRYASVESLSTDREHWEKILAMMKSREMPPPDVARPDAQV